MIIKVGEKVLTIHEAPIGGDSFEYSYGWDDDCLVRLNRDIQTEMEKGLLYGHFC